MAALNNALVQHLFNLSLNLVLLKLGVPIWTHIHWFDVRQQMNAVIKLSCRW